MKPTRAGLTVATLLSATTTCSKSPAGLEVLPENIATVQAAVDRITNDTVYVVATCGGSPALNCPGGVAGSPVPIVFTRDSIHVVQANPPDSSDYNFTAWTRAVTVRDIPITYFGNECGMAIDTRAAPSPNIQLSGTAHFTSQTTGGPINRLDISSISIAGLDTGDVSLTGSVLCTLGSFGLGFFINTLNSTLEDELARGLCGAPGPKLLEPCPPRPAADRTITGVAARTRGRAQRPASTLHGLVNGARASSRTAWTKSSSARNAHTNDAPVKT